MVPWESSDLALVGLPRELSTLAIAPDVTFALFESTTFVGTAIPVVPFPIDRSKAAALGVM